jgi:ArsR family transcriptional regulator, arsenate/arsenite/antimonite-responsive transcriptional repressor
MDIDGRRYLGRGIDVCQYLDMAKRTRTQTCCPSVIAAPLTEREAADLAKGFAALADPARLRLLSLIAAQPDGEVCACELVEPIGKSQPTVSHHLKVLREAGLVEGDKRGTWVWYRAVPDALDRLRAALSA